jgi:hypothetical protein
VEASTTNIARAEYFEIVNTRNREAIKDRSKARELADCCCKLRCANIIGAVVVILSDADRWCVTYAKVFGLCF